MRAHNQGCVTSPVYLPCFCVTNRQVIKTKLQVYLVNCGAPPPVKKKANGEKENIFFQKVALM